MPGALARAMSSLMVLRIVGLMSGPPTEFDGQYVSEYDANRSTPSPSGVPMLCHLRTTPNRDEALALSAHDALELWRAVDQREPTRPDGRPNRPLTAFTVEIVPV